MRRLLSTVLPLLVAGWLTTGGVAHAQGALVSASVAGASSDGTTSTLVGGSAGWQFNRVFGLGVELSHLRGLGDGFPRAYCCGEDDSRTGATVFTTNVRLDIPTLSPRVVPFVIGGGGVAAVTRTYSVVYALANALGLPADLTLPVLPGPSNVTSTSTSLALTLGGGASLLVSRHLSVDVDMRVLRLAGDGSFSSGARNIGRFGGGVSYRF